MPIIENIKRTIIKSKHLLFRKTSLKGILEQPYLFTKTTPANKKGSIRLPICGNIVVVRGEIPKAIKK